MDIYGGKKRQHYVPQFYFRNFSLDNIKFSILTVQNGKIIEAAPCNRQCYSDYFYQSQEAEDSLGDLETKVAPIIKKIINQSRLDITPNEVQLLKTYIIYQFFRTTGWVEYFIKSYGGILSEISKYYVHRAISRNNTEDFVRNSKGRLLNSCRQVIGTSRIVKLCKDNE